MEVSGPTQAGMGAVVSRRWRWEKKASSGPQIEGTEV
jgi:hypothetical protein